MGAGTPWTATSTAPSTSRGIPRLQATWFPVPWATTASGTSVPARPVMTSATVPSPPTATTAR
jgi:hypothetical protein